MSQSDRDARLRRILMLDGDGADAPADTAPAADVAAPARTAVPTATGATPPERAGPEQPADIDGPSRAHDCAAATEQVDGGEAAGARVDVPTRLEPVRREIHAEVVGILKQRGMVDDSESMHEAVKDVALELLMTQTGEPLAQSEREDIAKSIAEDVAGLGPIQYLIDDASVGEIM